MIFISIHGIDTVKEKIVNSVEKLDRLNIYIYIYISILIISLIYTYNVWYFYSMPIGLDAISNIADVPYYTESILKYGQFPLWNDLWFVGFPQYASPLTSFYYPISTIIYFLFGGLQGVKILILLHVFLSGVSFWIFSGILTNNKAPRLYGSLLYMLSGSLAARAYAGHLQMLMAFAYIPISAYLVIKAVETKGTKYISLSALTLALPILMGAPYYFAYWLLMLFAFALIKSLEYKDEKIKVRFDNLFVIALILVLTFGVSAILSIPILSNSDMLKRTVNPLGGSDTIDNLLFTLFHGKNLDFGANRMWGYEQSYDYGKVGWENYSFIGFIPLIFASLSIFHKSKHKKFLYAVLVVLIIYAQGSYTHFDWLHFLPFFDKLRVATRILAFVAFILISMAVLGLDWFNEELNNEGQHSKHILFIFVFFMLTTGLEYLKMISLGFDFDYIKILLLIMIAYLILSIAYLIFRSLINHKHSTFLISIILFSLLALIISNSQLFSPNPFIPSDIQSGNRLNEIRTVIKSPSSYPLTIEGSGNGGLNSLVEYGINSQNLRYYNAGYGYEYKYAPKTIDISGKEYSTIDLTLKYDLFYNSLWSFNLTEHNNSLPFAFAIHSDKIIPLKNKYYSPNKVIIDSESLSKGDLLVLKTAYHEGWKVDGIKVENFNGLIAVTSDGRQEYNFVFSPDDFKIGALITIIALIICTILYAYPKTLKIFGQDGH